MKKTLRFLGTGYNNYYQAKVIIYDHNKCLIYDGYTYNGIININIKSGCYYLEAKTNFGLIYKKIYIIDYISEYTFIFNNILINNNSIINFLLTDQYYANLPIMKGDIYLWQKQ